MEIVTRHEPEGNRFVVRLDGDDATLEYRHAGNKTLDYRSTFVPEDHRHQGIGERMVLDALDYARANDYSVIPTCPFVQSVLEDHPEYRDVIVEE